MAIIVLFSTHTSFGFRTCAFGVKLDSRRQWRSSYRAVSRILNSIPAFFHLIGPSTSFHWEAVPFWLCFTISVMEMGADFWWRHSRLRPDLLHTEQRIALLVK
jgi:hypothetical protein